MKKLILIFAVTTLLLFSCDKWHGLNPATGTVGHSPSYNPNLRVCMLGDSETRRINHYWGADTNWNTLTGIDSIFNFGYDAFQTWHILNIWGNESPVFQALDKNPDVIFLMAGINDAHQNTALSATLEYIRAIIDTVQSRNIDIVVQSVLPTTNQYDMQYGGFPQNGILAGRAKIMNDSLIIVCQQKNVPFLDVRAGLVTDVITRNGTVFLKNDKSIDGIHLNYAGYQIWSNHLMNYINIHY